MVGSPAEGTGVGPPRPTKVIFQTHASFTSSTRRAWDSGIGAKPHSCSTFVGLAAGMLATNRSPIASSTTSSPSIFTHWRTSSPRMTTTLARMQLMIWRWPRMYWHWSATRYILWAANDRRVGSRLRYPWIPIAITTATPREVPPRRPCGSPRNCQLHRDRTATILIDMAQAPNRRRTT